MTDRKIALCSWSLRPRGPADLADRLRSTEIAAVQLALSPLVRDPDAWAGSIDRLRGAGIEIVSGMMAMEGEDYSSLEAIARTGGVRPDATWPGNRAHAESVAEMAASHGIGLVTFHAGFLPEDEDDPERAVLLERLRDVARIFDRHGLRLGLETGQETAATLLDVLAVLNCPNVGVNFDPANMILYGKGEPVAALRRLLPKVVQIHIKDAGPSDVPGEWGTEVPVGDGAVDWDAFFRAALDAPHGPLAFVIEREAGEDRSADIRQARDLIRRHLDRA